jgi:hypothetical protein
MLLYFKMIHILGNILVENIWHSLPYILHYWYSVNSSKLKLVGYIDKYDCFCLYPTSKVKTKVQR